MPLITTTITPFTKTPSRQNPSTFSADMDDRLSEENSRITQMNNLGEEMNDVADLINAQSTSINTVSTNIAAVNTVATDISKVNTVSTNIAKVSNLDTNMTKIANLDTNMTKIANVDNNMTKVQNLDTNMTAITTVSTNVTSVNTVSTNIANVNIVANNIGSITTKVSLTGDETIAGVKTFSSSPIVPTSTTPTQAVNKGQLDLKSNIASPTFTGTPLSTTAVVGTNTTQIATTAFVNNEIANDAPTKTGGGASGTWPISISGTAAKWDTARTLSLTGAVTGSASIDGSGNVSLETTAKSPSYTNGVSKSYNTVYQASSDCVVVGIFEGSYRNGVQLIVGSTSSPTTEISRFGDDINSNTKAASIYALIKAGTYYKFQFKQVGGASEVFETTTITEYALV